MNNDTPRAFGQRAEFVDHVATCWNPVSPCRACMCGTFCAPCVYARGFELVHGGYPAAATSTWPTEWPQTLLGCANVQHTLCLAPYEATHDHATQATNAEFCAYCWVGVWPCVFCQPCQIAGEIAQSKQSAGFL